MKDVWDAATEAWRVTDQLRAGQLPVHLRVCFTNRKLRKKETKKQELQSRAVHSVRELDVDEFNGRFQKRTKHSI